VPGSSLVKIRVSLSLRLRLRLRLVLVKIYTFTGGWLGWVGWRRKLTSAKVEVEVEAELGNCTILDDML